MVLSDVYLVYYVYSSYFIQIKLHLLSYSVDFKVLESFGIHSVRQEISHGSGGRSERNLLQDRCYFHRSRSRKIALMFIVS